MQPCPTSLGSIFFDTCVCYDRYPTISSTLHMAYEPLSIYLPRFMLSISAFLLTTFTMEKGWNNIDVLRDASVKILTKIKPAIQLISIVSFFSFTNN